MKKEAQACECGGDEPSSSSPSLSRWAASQRLEACVRGGSLLTYTPTCNFSSVCPNCPSHHLKGEGVPISLFQIVPPNFDLRIFHLFPSSSSAPSLPPPKHLCSLEASEVSDHCPVTLFCCYLLFSGSISGLFLSN